MDIVRYIPNACLLFGCCSVDNCLGPFITIIVGFASLSIEVLRVHQKISRDSTVFFKWCFSSNVIYNNYCRDVFFCLGMPESVNLLGTVCHSFVLCRGPTLPMPMWVLTFISYDNDNIQTDLFCAN